MAVAEVEVVVVEGMVDGFIVVVAVEVAVMGDTFDVSEVVDEDADVMGGRTDV